MNTEDKKMLKVVYTFFLGLLLAIFVGVGTNTFYGGPKPPEYSAALETYGKDPTPEQIKLQKDYSARMDEYNRKMKPYNRNVSAVTLSAAVILLTVSLAFEKKIKIIADGIMLGGVFTLLYSLGRSFASEDTKYTFVVVSVGLIVAIYLGYHRFIKAQE